VGKDRADSAKHLIGFMYISVIIPTYRREEILLDTLKYLCELKPAPGDIILVDQTSRHQDHVQEKLASLEKNGDIRWIRLSAPSIPHAMNVGLKEAKNEIVLFLDDDIIPDKELIKAHLCAYAEGHKVVADQVLQPSEEPLSDDGAGEFRFCSEKKQLISEVMGANVSIKRDLALALDRFDENFVHVAYRFESEFAARALDAGERILFEPAASIRHLRSQAGGTRSYGEHLRTVKPSHSVGEYYYLLRSKLVRRRQRIIKKCREN
jgi:GT2 family glycosyltransferase